MNQRHLSFIAIAVAISLHVGCGQTPATPDGGQPSASDGGLRPFTPPSSAAVSGSILLTVTGEASAVEGNAFPPAGAGEPYFVDGWELEYRHAVVVFGAVTLSDNPDLNPGDQSQSGAPVATLDGVWAVDLAKGGSLLAKEQNGQAVALGRLTGQNLKPGTPAFSPTERYAFSYQLQAASDRAQNVNLDAEAVAAYDAMLANGWSVWLAGTARWRGSSSVPTCRTSGASYDFGRLPTEVSFSLGFAAPVTFKNCLNPDLMPEGTRGVQVQANGETLAQVTFHLDHPFWDSLEEDAPLRFDALAARKSTAQAPAPSASVTERDLVGLDFQAFTDAQGNALPYRYCGPTTPGEFASGTLRYEPTSVPVNPTGGAAGLADLRDYMTYNLSTFGHLNNDGLCFPQREYASPQ